MVLLNANHFTSLFCSNPFIGFLHIQSKTFLKCRKDLALAIALSLFFSPLLTCSTPNSSKPPSSHLLHRHSDILIVCQTCQEEHSHPRTSACAVPSVLRAFLQTAAKLSASPHSDVCFSIDFSELSSLPTLYK